MANATPSAYSDLWWAGMSSSPRGHQPRGEEADPDPEREPERDVLEDELVPDEVVLPGGQGGAEGEHGGQRQPVVHARLEVERVAHQARHARVGDHARGEHGIGRREQRAEQERLGPRQIREGVRDERDQDAGDRHGQDQLARRQPPLALEHLGLDLDAVAEQDHDQRDGGELDDEARLGFELEHLEAAVAQHEAGHHEHGGHRQEAAMRQAGGERAPDQQRPEDQRRDLELVHRGRRLP